MKNLATERWEVRHNEEHVTQIAVPGEKMYVCVRLHRTGEDEELREARMRLAASAPELLAKIQKCLNLAISKQGNGLSEYERCQIVSWLREATGD